VSIGFRLYKDKEITNDVQKAINKTLFNTRKQKPATELADKATQVKTAWLDLLAEPAGTSAGGLLEKVSKHQNYELHNCSSV
jgi:hypothetical protein